MVIYRFDEKVGFNIDKFDSNFVMSRVIETSEPANIGCMHIAANGIVGYHQAITPQLFLVVQGAGWVCAQDRNKVTVSEGSAVYWSKGEWHESGTEIGMTVIVIESEVLEPMAYMTRQQA